MTRHPLLRAYDVLLPASSPELDRAEISSADARLREHEAQESHPMEADTTTPRTRLPIPGLHPGAIVHYRRRDNPDDPKNPVTYPPLAALVIHVSPDGRTADVVVFGEGKREDWSRGKGLGRFRGDVRYHEDADATAARWWVWPPRG